METETTVSYAQYALFNYYQKRSDAYRDVDQVRLIISYPRQKTSDISASTVSSYIKQAIVEALLTQAKDATTMKSLAVKPHSVRAVAHSLKALRSTSIDDILQSGTWTTPNTFISHYLKYFSTDETSKLSRLNFVAAGSKF